MSAPALRMLTAAARSGLSMVLARRPTIDSPELAELDEAVAAGGVVDVLAPLDFEQTRALIAVVTGGTCSAETAKAVLAASGGLPAIAVTLAALSGASPGPPPMLVARLQRRMALLGPQQAHTARVLALRLQVSDDALALACGLDPPGLEAALQVLRDNGMLVAGTEQMIPAVAETLIAGLAGGQRRRLHDDVARALVATGAAPSVAATQLRAARARGPAAAAAYLAAGEDLRFSNPAAALGWFDDAADAGALDAAVAPGRAEAGALLGMPDDPDAVGITERDAVRLSLVAGAVAAHQGRADRAAAGLLTTAPPGPELAVPALVATGQLAAAQKAAGDLAPAGLRLLAETALACPNPAAALPLAIEAAEALERTTPSHLLLDTPHALGAVLAVLSGDVSTAEHLLERALKHGVGGPVFADRHRLLLAWARMRAGRLDTAQEQVARLSGADLGGRDRVLFAAVSAGLARRAGDIASLRETWPGVERVLARRGLDLFQIEAAEELAVAAARLRRSPRMAPILASFEAILEGLGSPPAWVIGFGWLQLQVAVAADDPGAARSAADRIAAAAPAGTSGERQAAQQVAASAWAAALAGEVDPDLVIAACDGLAAVELPWEASRLAGDAAIRVRGAAPARRLLERARELTAPVVRTVDPAQQAGLSEREIEVARQVLAGRTHREIGAQLFIAPKTVEHHVARIRTKLGATTRADFFSTLQSLFGATADPP
ncbi:MAG TPA: helix-turn-helix transcriptional regulator [Kineosporiaceae bacterium]|nr:helix-turn-helix transcriptional regulator [Kineosporiaceae bacterium]